MRRLVLAVAHLRLGYARRTIMPFGRGIGERPLLDIHGRSRGMPSPRRCGPSRTRPKDQDSNIMQVPETI